MHVLNFLSREIERENCSVSCKTRIRNRGFSVVKSTRNKKVEVIYPNVSHR